jgi:hypothetical protein
MDALAIPVCHDRARQQKWINRSLSLLKNNDALPKRCGITMLVLADDH